MKRNLFSISSKFRIFFIFALLTVFLSCEKDEVIPEPPVEMGDFCKDTNYTYSTDIKPIMVSNCATSSCHDGSNSLPDYSTYAGVFDDKARIRNGIIIGLTQLTGGRAKLTKEEEETILCWIKDDAPK